MTDIDIASLPANTNILVRGGYTGTKLHRARAGGSSLGCGYWTKTSVARFAVADNVRDETLEARKHELCERCFPGIAVVSEKPARKAWDGPKEHFKRISVYVKDGKVLATFRKDKTACGVRSGHAVAYAHRYAEFKQTFEESPERCCSKCVADFERTSVRIAELRAKANRHHAN